MGVKGKAAVLAGALLSLVYPPRCAVCDDLLPYESRVRTGEHSVHMHGVMQGVHPECMKRIQVIDEPVCMKCGQPIDSMRKEYCFDCMEKSHSFVQGKSIFLYKGEMKQSMYRFKYAARQEYAAFYAAVAAEKQKAWIESQNIEVIVPVPMYERKKKRRGYNQAELFAKELSRQCGIPCRTDLLKRVKNTKPQKQLNDAERKNNLKNAFHVSQDIVKYKYILLVDDIYTTGSTIDAAAEAMRQQCTGKIFFLSICIGKGL